ERFVSLRAGEQNGERRTKNQELDSDNLKLKTQNATLYRTGDQARWLPDGTLVFAGRLDGQVKLRGFRIELGEIEAVLARHPLVAEALVLVRGEENPRLVAYVVPSQEWRTESGEAGIEETELNTQNATLKTHLAERLPEYMVPSAVVVLERFPLTPNGKIDRKALPEPDERPNDTALVAPRTPVEVALAEIWAAVLRVPEVGVHDNFFRLGGDSILSIQIVARAGQAGLRLSPRLLFQHQTIAELALVVEQRTAVQAQQGLVEGPALLTPIQRWFLRQDFPAPQHFNLDLLLLLSERVAPEALAGGLLALLAHHDALRLRFTPDAEGGWRAEHGAPPTEAPLAVLDLSALPPEQQDAAQEQAATAVQSSLDLEHGPLLRALLLERGPEKPQRLLLVVHHLVVDVVSWGVLLADLRQAVAQAQRGQAVQLPPKTSAWRDWADALPDATTRLLASDELTFWTEVLQADVPALPRDHIGGANTVADARQLMVALDEEATTALLQQVHSAYQTQTPDLLLAALAETWRSWTGSRSLRVALEGHGREEVLAPELDVTRTVGWFTSVYPLLLTLPAEPGPGAALKAIKEQVRRVPQHGVGYGLLREGTDALPPEPPFELSFNYLGQVDQTLGAANDWTPVSEPVGPAQHPGTPRTYLLDVTAQVRGGKLLVGFTYSLGIHSTATVQRLAEAYLAALRDLIAHCLAPDAGGFTPSDFAEYQWDQTELDDITAAISKSLGVE
ncbi:MAG TPA: condensation domain-containing protein, partial [Roseiflexaceae bacterium]|nr:condensation domain-containing protein [Roseiflexaceae bacterium]